MTSVILSSAAKWRITLEMNVAITQVGWFGPLSTRMLGRGIPRELPCWPKFNRLGALMAVAVLAIAACTEEPTPKAYSASPTAVLLAPTKTVATIEISTPTPTPVDPVDCERGMIVPRGSGCWARHRHMVYDPDVDYLFNVNHRGHGRLRVDDRLLQSGDESIHLEFVVKSSEGGCGGMSKTFLTVLHAVRNGDGSWTVKKVMEEHEVSIDVICAATPTPTAPAGPHFGGSLRIASPYRADSLDPIFTDAYSTIVVSSHIFETPLGWNSALEVKPRMAENWELSPDTLTYTFHLRGGLRFHNGDSVEAGDIVASLVRWLSSVGSHANLLRGVINRDKPFSVVDSETFAVNLDEPYGLVPSAFARPHGGPFILPEEIVGSSTALEFIGSGAYKFTEWRQGDRITIEKFEDYMPASGPPDLYVGGTAGYLDSVTWLEIPDEETRIAGLEIGEWDVVEMASFDYFERLDENPDIAVPLYRPGHRSWYQLSPSHPPFDNLKMRRAALYATNVQEVMYSLGSDELWDLCPAIYYCGTPLETDAGGDEWYARFDSDRAKRLLEESSYAGETIVLLNPTDYATITLINDVIRRQFEEVGFSIELLELDWATVVLLMNEPETVEILGWAADGAQKSKPKTIESRVSVGWQSHWCCGDPVSDPSGGGESPLWPRIPHVTELRHDWARETDPVKKAAILDEYQIALYENVYNVYLGVFYPMFPHDSDLKGFEVKAIPFYSNSWLQSSYIKW